MGRNWTSRWYSAGPTEDGQKGKEDVEYREKGEGEKKRTGWVGGGRRGMGRGGVAEGGVKRECWANRDPCGHLTTRNLAASASG